MFNFLYKVLQHPKINPGSSPEPDKKRTSINENSWFLTVIISFKFNYIKMKNILRISQSATQN